MSLSAYELEVNATDMNTAKIKKLFFLNLENQRRIKTQ